MLLAYFSYYGESMMCSVMDSPEVMVQVTYLDRDSKRSRSHVMLPEKAEAVFLAWTSLKIRGTAGETDKPAEERELANTLDEFFGH